MFGLDIFGFRLFCCNFLLYAIKKYIDRSINQYTIFRRSVCAFFLFCYLISFLKFIAKNTDTSGLTHVLICFTWNIFLMTKRKESEICFAEFLRCSFCWLYGVVCFTIYCCKQLIDSCMTFLLALKHVSRETS